MTQPLSSFKRLQVVNTFKNVKSIRETSILCKASRNTVRKVLREAGFSPELKNEMFNLGKANKALSTIPPINEKSSWNPLNSNLYKSLKRLETSKPAEPWIIENLRNLSLLMTGLGNELNIGSSVVGTMKLEFLMRSYIDFCDAEAKAAAYASDLTLTKDKQVKFSIAYKAVSEKALKNLMSILSELEGKTQLKNLKFQQNNININVP